VDIVVEATGSRGAARESSGDVCVPIKFGTAVVVLPDGLNWTLPPRGWVLQSPAALPTIELSSIKRTCTGGFHHQHPAVRLNKAHYGELIDFFGGMRDIKEKPSHCTTYRS
jgi:tRNA nucleotidyltransferase (CCA-adding enzyme)